ncbi:MAG: carboxypeptidase-like regulatory domain-containing protein, partial [Bacteroidota bacterium]
MNKYNFILGLLLSMMVTSALAQEEDHRVVQLTGVVFGKDSTRVVPGVHVYTPKAGRGTTTNPYGFFSLPVLEGDSIVFSSVGFQKAHYIVPEHREDHSIQIIV